MPTLLKEALLQRGQPTVRFEHKGIFYRVSHLTQHSANVFFLRRLPDIVPDLATLGLPSYLVRWLMSPDQCMGLVLVSGRQTSGKTTFAGSLIAARLKKYGGHGITFENPAELPLNGPWGEFGYCFQTEIAGESALAKEIEHAHRYGSPDIVFIGEIKTKHAAVEALRVALGSNRQLVVATIHGQSAEAALQRLTVWARELEGVNALQNLSQTLLAVVHLRLEEQWDEEEQRDKLVLACPDPLLVSFKEPHGNAIRAKLGDGQFHDLELDMRAVMHRIANEGEDSV
jgi:twitching motility protein PilT